MKLEDTVLENVMDLIWEEPEETISGSSLDVEELQAELDQWNECPDPESMISVEGNKRMGELEHVLDNVDQYSTIIHESSIDEYIIDTLQGCFTYDNILEPYIDWASMAEDSKVDYSVVEFEGDDYYISP